MKMKSDSYIEYLPVGSVVMVKGMIRKTVIIGRGLLTIPENDPMYFDYGGCLYPEGLQGDAIMYFNHKDIVRVISRGYEDEENSRMVNNLNEWLEESGMKHAEPTELNRILREQGRRKG